MGTAPLFIVGRGEGMVYRERDSTKEFLVGDETLLYRDVVVFTQISTHGESHRTVQ